MTNKFFDINTTLSHNYFLNFITSNRGVGKTYSTLKLVVNNYLKKGEPFALLRRLDVEIDKTKHTIFKALECNNVIPKNSFYIKGNYIIHNKNTNKQNKKDNQEICGYIASINNYSKLKGINLPNLKYIIFDEFIAEQDNFYIANEVERFLSIIESLGRLNNNLRVICLANQMTIYNPYYNYFNIKPRGIITKYKDKNILIHNFTSELYNIEKSKTNFGKLISNTDYGKFMLMNENISDTNDYIDNFKKYSKISIANFITRNNNYHLYKIPKKNCLYINNNINIDKTTYNFDQILKESATLASIRNNWLAKIMRAHLKRGKLFFNNPFTRDEVIKTLKLL